MCNPIVIPVVLRSIPINHHIIPNTRDAPPKSSIVPPSSKAKINTSVWFIGKKQMRLSTK
jgi:hypothetical protein